MGDLLNVVLLQVTPAPGAAHVAGTLTRVASVHARYFLSHDAFRSSIRPFEDARYFLEDGDAACARTAAYVEGAQL
jgi:hypothetical protein